jgi:hydrogenase maturation protein HypF
MLCSFGNYERLASFTPVPLPGGDQASRQPWRNLYAHLSHWTDWQQLQRRYGSLSALAQLQRKPLHILDRLMEAGTNSPLCSSAGRLLDACAALLGLCFEVQDYEGEAPSLLESLASDWTGPATAYPTGFEEGKVTWAGLFHGMLEGLSEGCDPRYMARRVHETIVESCVGAVMALSGHHDFSCVALSGGCFNNTILLETLSSRLEGAGFRVLSQHNAPCGDGGLALGQCAVAMAQALDGRA